MQQHAFQKLSEPGGEGAGPGGCARQCKEALGISASEVEFLSRFDPPRCVPAKQDEVTEISHKNKTVLREVAGNLLTTQLNVQLRGDIIDFDDAAVRWPTFGPTVRPRDIAAGEEPHIGEARASVAEVRHAEDAGSERSADGVQRTGEAAIVANLSRTSPGVADSGNTGEVIGEDLGSHDRDDGSLSRGRARARWHVDWARSDYLVSLGMARVDFAQTDLFAPVQPDLFAPPASEPCPPSVDALGELQALLDKVRGASVLPWIDAAEAMGEEHRVLWLAAQAGNEGARLAQAIFEETERLFSVSE